MNDLMPMPCDEWEKKLAAIHPDDLSPAEREALNAHLATCSACSAVLSDYHKIDELIHSSLAISRPLEVGENFAVSETYTESVSPKSTKMPQLKIEHPFSHQPSTIFNTFSFAFFVICFNRSYKRVHLDHLLQLIINWVRLLSILKSRKVQMAHFLLSRAIGLILVIFGASFLTFIMGYFAPGDPITAKTGNKLNLTIHLQLKHEYGLDLPWWQQYYHFLINMLHGSFGPSFQYPNSTAWEVIQRGLPTSIELGLEVFVVSLIVGIPLGIVSALRANTYIDTIVTSVTTTLYRVPNFVLIIAFHLCMLWLATNNLPHLPLYGWDNLQERIAPVLITAIAGIGYFTRLTRTSMLEVLELDFIRTARAKGLREQIVIVRHAMRYAFIPILTSLGHSLGYLVTGIFFTERFFEIPGVSQFILDAIDQGDYPVLQAGIILIIFSIVFFNTAVSVAYTLLNYEFALDKWPRSYPGVLEACTRVSQPIEYTNDKKNATVPTKEDSPARTSGPVEQAQHTGSPAHHK